MKAKPWLQAEQLLFACTTQTKEAIQEVLTFKIKVLPWKGISKV